MNLLITLVVGFVVGLIARAILPGRHRMGMILTTLLGMGGAILATYGGQALGLYLVGETAGWIASIIGAMILLWIYGILRK